MPATPSIFAPVSLVETPTPTREASVGEKTTPVQTEAEAHKLVPVETAKKTPAQKPVPVETAKETPAHKPVPVETAKETPAHKPVPVETAKEEPISEVPVVERPVSPQKSVAVVAEVKAAEQGQALGDEQIVLEKPGHASQAREVEVHMETADEDEDDVDQESQEIPSLDNSRAPRPSPTAASLTEGAIDRRMRRVFTAKASGEFKVGKKFVEMWQKRGTSRMNLINIFASCGYNPVLWLAIVMPNHKLQGVKLTH